MTIQEFITGKKEEITAKLGLSTDDVDYVETFIKAGIEDLQSNGVTDAVITGKNLSVITLVQFCMDNMQETPGSFKTSPMYISNVQKLRYMGVDTDAV